MEELTEKVAAGELADYQKQAITSRTIVKEAGGSITFFAFDEGQELSEHTTPFEALVHVLEGRAAIVVGGREHEVAAGELLLMPAGVPHALRAIERFKMLLVMIKTR